ncbi:hypothetical protein [Pseudomonas sp. CGJS7]|uniref:hypothetical protein n=1 Tax=Pseudomonas sp. CGJS7 TaxID=3109348 RepID=UPI00300B3F39
MRRRARKNARIERKRREYGRDPDLSRHIRRPILAGTLSPRGPSNVHYDPQDTSELTRSSFSVGIGSPGFLADMVAAGKEYASDLSRYPYTLHDALAAHYMSLRGMAALEPKLLDDLLRGHGVRGQIFAAWFAALAPHRSYRQPLLEALEPPHKQHALHLALQAIDELDGAAATESSLALAEIRASLLALPQPAAQFRRVPTPQQLQRMDVERERIAAIYRSDGAEAARDSIEGTIFAYYRLDHRQWRRLGCPSLERYLGEIAAD